MNDLNKISRGEVFYITSKFDTVGSEQKSGRPAVVVSNNMCNDCSPVIEVCYMTLQVKKPMPTHVFVDRGQCINSTILCEQITSVSLERIGEYMCTLPDDIMDAVDKALIVSLGLDYIIEQETKNPVKPASTPTKEVIPQSTLEQMDKMRAEISALEAQNKELITARDSAMKKFEDTAKKVEGAELAKQEAKLYKKMYDSLLDKVLGK